jgi:PAS domain S-box-containing protein
LVLIVAEELHRLTEAICKEISMSIGKSPVHDSGFFKRSNEAPTRRHRYQSGHAVQFYGDDGAFLDSLGQSVGAALEAGDGVIVIATKAHRNGLAQRLKARGLDTAAAIERGRYVLLDATETLSKFLQEGWPDATCFADIMGKTIARARAAAKGDDPDIFAFGEMVALLWAEGKSEAAFRLEQLWNELARTQSFTLRCAYPLKKFDREEHGELFLKICAEHSDVIPGESYTALGSEEERLRNISFLQQKVQVLDRERAERLEIEKSLRLREAELAELLENAPEGVHQTDPDQKILWANNALLKLFGYRPEELIGHHLSEFFVQENTLDEYWGKLMRREEVIDFPAEFRCKDGSIKDVFIHSNGLWKDGQFVRTRSFIRDVTERNGMIQALKLAHEELEMRVSERTAELEQKNLQILEQAKILEMKNRDLRELSARLLQVQDDERRRIARDLHDGTGQMLALLSMTLSRLETEAGKFSPELAKGLAENVEIVKEVSAELRTLSYLLHPPLLDETGLESALRWYVDGFGKRSGIEVALDLPDDLGRLSRELETAIYRIVQECLTNIHRHSESLTATIRLSQSPGQIALEIKDDGRGIPQEKLSKIASTGLPGVGLRGMRERIMDFHGELEITSRAKGTDIKIIIPLDATAPGVRLADSRAL